MKKTDPTNKKKINPNNEIRPTVSGGCLFVKNGPGPFFLTAKPKQDVGILSATRIVPGIEYTFSLQLGESAPDSEIEVEIRGYFATVVKKLSGELALEITSEGSVGDFLDQSTGYFDGISTVEVVDTTHTDVDFKLLATEMSEVGNTMLLILGRGVGDYDGKIYEFALAYNVEVDELISKKGSMKKKTVKKKTVNKKDS